MGVSVGPQPLQPYEEGVGELMYFQTLKGDPITHKYKTGGPHNFRDGNSQIGDCQLEIYPMKHADIPMYFLWEATIHLVWND